MSRVTQDTSVDRHEDLKEVARFSSMLFDQIASLLNNGLRFSDNFDAKLLDITFSAASTNSALNHGLDRVPAGYLVLRRSANITVYDGTSSWNASTMYLGSSGAGTVKVLVF